MERWRRASVIAGVVALLALTSCSQPAATLPLRVVHGFGARADIWGLSALGGTDVWVTGDTCQTACAQSSDLSSSVLLARWDGRSWQNMPAPGGLAFNTAGWDVSALSADDAWLVADGQQGKDPESNSIPYVLHWRDHRWTAHRFFVSDAEIYRILAFNDRDVWVFGAVFNAAPGNRTIPVDYHFDGRTWHRFSLGSIGAADVAASGPDDIWVVGQAAGAMPENGPVPTSRTGFHWDGSSWRSFALPGLGPARGSNDVWGAGIYVTGHRDIWIAYTRRGKNGPDHVVALWRGTAGTWQDITLPGFILDQPQSWTGAGCDGDIWVGGPVTAGAPGSSPTWLAHYGNGRWTGSLTGADHGTLVTMNGGLTCVPGTSQVWAPSWLTVRHAADEQTQPAVLALG